MARVIAIANQKGGVGKTTTAVNLGAYLAISGRRTLLVDIDPQGNATSGTGIDKAAIERCMYSVLIDGVAMEEIIVPTLTARFDVAPSTISLAGVELELVAKMSREYFLKEALRGVIDGYDYVLIDSPPSLGLLTVNGLSAADEVLVPIQCEYYALEGLSQLIETIEMVRSHLNPRLTLSGVLLTMYDVRTNLSQQVVEDVKAFFGHRIKVFDTVIPRNVRLSEAPSFGQPIAQYDDRSKGAEAYRELASEVVVG